MKQFMLAVHNDPTDTSTDDWGPEDWQPVMDAVEAFNTDLRETGAYVFACGLNPIEDTTTIRLKEGEPLLTDGPFAETKEYLGGFWIVKAVDLDAAHELARKAAVACRGAVQVRPLQDESED